MLISPLIQDYSPEWPERYRGITKVLATALAGLPAFFHHVGSTAVPGLAAKPIIDIDVEYPPEVTFTEVKSGLESLGYRHHGDQGIPQREVFKLTGDTSLTPKILKTCPHHLYACPLGSSELVRHLRFRDALRVDASLRDEYAAIKFRIADAAWQDRKRYAALKENEAKDFVEGVIRLYREITNPTDPKIDGV